MSSQILRVSILWVAASLVVAATAGSAQADVCVTIDQARDTFSPDERVAALLLFARQFEAAGERVVSGDCSAPYTVAHIRLGNTIIVTLSGPGGLREATAIGLDDLPALYNQMVRSIVTGQPMTAMGVVDRTNVTASQASARRVHTDSLWYARLGYGNVFGNRSYGTPALGFGYRAELDSFAIDVAFLNFQLATNDASSHASAGSVLKLSGLYFLNPTADRAGYVGGGLSYGRVNFGERNFNSGLYRTNWSGDGLQGELTVGYEIARATSLRLFVQADAVLPFYQAMSETYSSRTGVVVTTDRRYAPSLIVSIGLGR